MRSCARVRLAEECDHDLVIGACSGRLRDDPAHVGAARRDRTSDSAAGDSRMPRGVLAHERPARPTAGATRGSRVRAAPCSRGARGRRLRGQRRAHGPLPRRRGRPRRRWLSSSASPPSAAGRRSPGRAAPPGHGRSRAAAPFRDRSRTRTSASASSSTLAVFGSSATPIPVRSIAAAPANWSVENGSTTSGTP